MPTSWTCPFCKQPTTITDFDVKDGSVRCLLASNLGPVMPHTSYKVCPNTKCKKLSLEVTLVSLKRNNINGEYDAVKLLRKWDLIPESTAKVYSPEVIPQAIVNDYEEACKVKTLSPKASATLARRALQGMIRNFYSGAVKKYREEKNITGFMKLGQEIKAIKTEIDPEVWEAIEAVRSIGNIGAHMEEDINVIIDVEPGEAEQLISLIELLIEEWYINRQKRKERLAGVIKLAAGKKPGKEEKPLIITTSATK